MAQDMMTRIVGNQRQSWRRLTVTVVLLFALAMMTTVAFAAQGGDPSEKDDTLLSDVGSAIRADANPGMDVAFWYAPAAASSASGASWAIRVDANPSMDVARWYAPGEVSSAPGASWAIRGDANPSMDVARWYAPGEVSSAPGASWAIRGDANPSMDVASWYAPAEVGAQDLLCAAEDLGAPCP